MKNKLSGHRAREAAEAIKSTPSLRAAARRLGVSHSTLSRAIRDGRLPGRARLVRRTDDPESTSAAPMSTDWLTAIQERYELSPTEHELAKLASAALAIAADPDTPPSVKLAAAGRFAQLVKDLALPTEEGNGEAAPGTYPRAI